MIVNCSRNWALDETRTRCENAPEKFSFPVEDYLPVVGKNGFTYRNKHCAECNGEMSYQSWYIEAQGPIKPPEEYNLDDRLQFILEHGGGGGYDIQSLESICHDVIAQMKDTWIVVLTCHTRLIKNV